MNAIVLKNYFLRIVFIITLLLLIKVLFLPFYPDFKVHYFGASHIIRGENPYINDANYFTPQAYPPFDMVIFIPFTLLSLEAASKLWVILSIVLVVWSIYLCCRIYRRPFYSQINLIIYSLIFISFPLKFTLGMGQINALILFFVVLGFYFLNMKKNSVVGISLAFPIMLKFFPLLLVPYFVILRKWKILSALFLTVFFLLLLTFVFFPTIVIVHYFRYILPDLFSSWKGDYYNQALSGFLMRSVSDPILRNTFRIIISLILLIVNFIIIVSKKTKNIKRINLEIASLLILSVLINSFSWQHHFIFLILPFIIIFYALQNQSKSVFLYIFLAISYILISINFKNPNILPLLFQSHVFFGGLILWIINLYMLLKYKI